MNTVDILILSSFALFALLGLLGSTIFAARSFKLVLPGAFFGALTVPDAPADAFTSSRWARLFGVPNWWLGVFYYILLLCISLFTLIPAIPEALILMTIIGSLIAACASGVLLYAEKYVLKVSCRACLLIHIANFGSLAVWCASAIALASSIA